MDESKFDKIIKAKLMEYRAPLADAGSLEEFHRQSEGVLHQSWVSRYRTEVLIAAGIAFILLLYLIDRGLITSNLHAMEEDTRIIKTQQLEIEQLKTEITSLKMRNPDTVRIIQIKQSPSTLILAKRIATLEQANLEISQNVRFVSQEPHYSYRENSEPSHFENGQTSSSLVLDAESAKDFRSAAEQQSPTSHEKSLSTKSIRELEKHYTSGVGIKIGPAAEIFGSSYSLGDGHFNFSGGVLTEFILSPAIGVETGLKYSDRAYAISDNGHLSNPSLPNVDNSFGELQRAEIDYRMVEIPLTLKYRYPISLKRHWLAGIGYSSMIYLNQDFEYTYYFDNHSTNPTSIVSTVSVDGMKAYAGSFNLSLGMSQVLKNRKILEGTLFYNHGIGTQGVEKTKARYFGLRAVYWFTLR